MVEVVVTISEDMMLACGGNACMMRSITFTEKIAFREIKIIIIMSIQQRSAVIDPGMMYIVQQRKQSLCSTS